MATIDLPQEIDERLDRLAAETGFSRTLLLSDLWRMGIEDLEDYYEAHAAGERVRSGQDRVYSAAEVRASLGLGD